MNKEIYESPDMEIVTFGSADIVTTSNSICDTDGMNSQMPYDCDNIGITSMFYNGDGDCVNNQITKNDSVGTCGTKQNMAVL